MKKSMLVSGLCLVVALFGAGCAKAEKSGDGATDENWPSGETMEMIVGYSAGGTTDTMARELAAELEKKLDVQIQVVNQDGAGGQQAYTDLANAEPDGLTIGTINYPTILSTMIDKSKGATYKLDDFQLLANHVNDPRITVVQPDSDYKNADDLVEYAKENPGKLRGATSGLAGGGHFSMLKLEEATGADFSPVHFDTGQEDAKAAFLGGHVDVYFASVGDALEIIESGDGRPVGLMDEERSDLLPDVPTFKEQGIDVQEAGMRGYSLPAGVPEERLKILSDALEEIITSPEHKKALAKLSLVPAYMDPEEYAAWLDEQLPTVEKFNEVAMEDK